MRSPRYSTRILLALGLGACASRAPMQLERAPISERAAAAPAGASTTSDRTSAVPAHDTSAPSAADVERRLRAHFSQFVVGTDFRFFERDFAPRVERYLSLRDVAVADLEREARRFYGDKTKIALVPEPGTVALETDQGRSIASFVLRMAWSREPPPAARKCGFLDENMQWRPGSTVDRSVDVDAELVMDAAGRFVAYDEHGVRTPQLRVSGQGEQQRGFPSLPTSPVRQLDSDPSTVTVPDATLVDDLGERFTCAESINESDEVRLVRLPRSLGAKRVWMLASWTFFTGHNFVGADVLVPAVTR